VRPAADAATGKRKANERATLRFDLEFQHRLTNTTKGYLEGIRIYVPVPEDCYQQKVTNLVWLRGGQPARVAIQKDQYGQRVASFRWSKLPPGGNLVVGFRCRATLRKPLKAKLPKTKLPKTGCPESAGDETAKIPPDVRTAYTKDSQIYCLASVPIRRKARELADGCQNLVERVRAIYDFVAQDLTYIRQGGWDPAPEVLARKSGSCSEFSYLFSSLCRANGIPTRFVGATMFRPKQVKKYPYVDKVWHRWVQVYLPGVGWVHMDPTRDRGKAAKHHFFGRQPGPGLVLSHHGGNSRFLGNHYVSADNQSSKKVKRVRRFSWMPVAAKKTRVSGKE
jgi:transglutaminase-like putative cysteine protease